MNTHESPTAQSRFPKLVYAPLGLLIVALAMRGVASPVAAVAVDLLALGLTALAGWLGGEFVLGAGGDAAVREARPRHRHRARHTLRHRHP